MQSKRPITETEIKAAKVEAMRKIKKAYDSAKQSGQIKIRPAITS